MPTIKARKQASGETRYTAIVGIRRGGTVIHREAKTFTHRTAAVSWAKHREVILEDPSALARVQYGAPTLAVLIRWNIEPFKEASNEHENLSNSKVDVRVRWINPARRRMGLERIRRFRAKRLPQTLIAARLDCKFLQ